MKEDSKTFPVEGKTACLLKWAWSTIYLGQGTSSSCHRTDQAPIPVDNFASFHNLPNKIRAREMMRRGEWPQEGCQYCEKIEAAGGTSDRQYQLLMQHDLDRTPTELLEDPTLNEVVPTILEIYFNNVCNMSCLYCGSHFSSKWEEETKKYGEFHQNDVHIANWSPKNQNYEEQLAQFWKYLSDENRYEKIRYYQILGGEPFYQKEFDQSIEFWEAHPNPELTFNIITNLKVPPTKFKNYIDRFEAMVNNGALKRLQITGSIDSWGPQEEYVRYGLDLTEWEENFTYLLDKPWVVQCVNAAISPLTIKTAPELIEKINYWNDQKDPWQQISYSFMTVMGPPYMDPAIFGSGVFDEDFDRILSVMRESNPSEINAREHMKGIAKQIAHANRDVTQINNLKVYLDEIDKRRNTNWKELFPWLNKIWN